MIATQSEELRALVPEFFGAIQCEKVLDETGKDISHEFHLSIGYKMRKIDGEFIKSGLLGISEYRDQLIRYRDQLFRYRDHAFRDRDRLVL